MGVWVKEVQEISDFRKNFKSMASLSDSTDISTARIMPNYEHWRNGFEVLENDREGYELFQQYLTEENLGHILEFR